jgi:hypothetical protein
MYSMFVQKIAFLIAVLSLTSLINVHADDNNVQAADDSAEFSVMNVLSEHHLHDLKDERWNFYSQATYITNVKDAFPAAYSNLNGSPNSFKPQCRAQLHGHCDRLPRA